MPQKKHTKENIIQVLRGLAKKLGKDTLTSQDIAYHLAGHVSLSGISYHFGSLGKALSEAQLKVTKSSDHFKNRGNILSDSELFESLSLIEEKVGHEPGLRENDAFGLYSHKPFRKRFGHWTEVLKHYRKWKAENPQGELKENKEAKITKQVTSNSTKSLPSQERASKAKPVLLYGEPIDFRGLRNAPTNEMGVVYLFAMVCRELGFSIDAIGSAFPDCQGKYLYDKKKNLWAEAKIEFEFRASNFKEHGHNAELCDFIVCWHNDWPDSPVTVIDLSKEIIKLPSR